MTVKTSLRPLDMAVLVGCRTLLQAFRVHAADRDRACRLAAASFCTRHYVFSGQVSASRRHGAVTRHYSSDSKDDLRVRYLDGDDAGEFRSVQLGVSSNTWKFFSWNCQNANCCRVSVNVNRLRNVVKTRSTVQPLTAGREHCG